MANYSVRNDGTAANKAAAEDGDKTLVAECMDVGVFNGETFAANDNIYFWSNTDTSDPVYRERIFPLSGGTSGNRISYHFDTNVQLNGSDILDSGWSLHSGSIYKTSVDEPINVYFDDARGDLQESIVACTSDGDWYWESSVLYFYSSGGSPETAYTNPGVEATYRNCIFSNKSYLNFYGNGCDIRNAHSYAIWIRSSGEPTNPITDIDFKDFVVHDTSGNTVSFWDTSNVVCSGCEIYRSGWNAVTMGSTDPGSKPPMSVGLFENCYFHDCHHGGFDFHHENADVRTMSGIVCRFNYLDVLKTPDPFYNDISIYYMVKQAPGDKIKDCDTYGNVVVRGKQGGIGYDRYGAAGYLSGMKCYNNTVVYCGQDGEGAGITAQCVGGEFKNNICFENQQAEYSQNEIRVNDGGGVANVMDYNCIFHSTHTNIYEWEESNYTAANIFSSTGQQEHAVHADPKFTDADNDDFTLASDSPCRDVGDNTLGSPYNIGLLPQSKANWPSGVVTGDQDDY